MRQVHRYIILSVVVVLAFQVGLSDDPAVTNREVIKRCFWNLAKRAQEYYVKPRSLRGGEGSFALLTFSTLSADQYASAGRFILHGASATSMHPEGDGVETGYDGANPVQVEMEVFVDSITVTVTN
jgi:hypothetical protein